MVNSSSTRLESLPSKPLFLDGEASALTIGQPKFLLPEELPESLIFGLEIIDDLLLSPAEPPGKDDEERRQG